MISNRKNHLIIEFSAFEYVENDTAIFAFQYWGMQSALYEC